MDGLILLLKEAFWTSLVLKQTFLYTKVNTEWWKTASAGLQPGSRNNSQFDGQDDWQNYAFSLSRWPSARFLNHMLETVRGGAKETYTEQCTT